MVDQLAREAAGSSVIFLRHDVDHSLGDRQSRWWAANTAQGSVYLPLVMADSGHLISNGPVEFRTVYQGMIAAEAPRAPGAAITAWVRRIDTRLRVYSRITNLLPIALSAGANAATVHAIVGERPVAGGFSTVKAATSQLLATALAPGASAGFVAEIGSVGGADPDRTDTVVLLDYRPGGTTGAWDLAQAAVARTAALVSDPSALDFGVVTSAAADPTRTVALTGPHVMSWSATANVPWLRVTPATGSLPAQVEVTVTAAALTVGAQSGTVTVTGTSADGLALTGTLAVTATRPGGLRRHLSRAGS